jgi:hypothetical protein
MAEGGVIHVCENRGAKMMWILLIVSLFDPIAGWDRGAVTAQVHSYYETHDQCEFGMIAIHDTRRFPFPAYRVTCTELTEPGSRTRFAPQISCVRSGLFCSFARCWPTCQDNSTPLLDRKPWPSSLDGEQK